MAATGNANQVAMGELSLKAKRATTGTNITPKLVKKAPSPMVSPVASPITQLVMAKPKKLPTTKLRRNKGKVRRRKGAALNMSKHSAANKNRTAINIIGGISTMASLENIQLMAATKVTNTNSRSD